MPKGYGRFKDGDAGLKYAHRLSFEIECACCLTPEQVVRHSCDNPPCCNPAHLLLGTQQDNLADMHSRGRARGNTLRGQASGRCGVTPEREAEVLRHLGQPVRTVARMTGVTREIVKRIFKNAS